MRPLFKIFVILLLILMVGCAQQDAEPLRLGTNVWPGYEPLYLARHNQYLKDDEVRLLEFSSTTQVIRAYRNGLIDAAALTLDEALLLLEQGEDLKIVLVMDISDGGDVILARPGITEMSELQDKRVGVENNALGAYVLSRAMEINKLDIKSIELVSLEINEQEDAYRNKEVDAVVSFDPVRSALLKLGANLLFDSSEIPGEIVDVLVVRETYLKNNINVVQSLLDSWYQALAEIKRSPLQTAKTLGLRTKLNEDEVLASYKVLKLPNQFENQNLLQKDNPRLLSSVQKLKKVMLRQKLLKQDVTPSSLFSTVVLQHR